ncbi:MAG: hypothetical protein JXO22_13095 [Phycisphaerae bacterium]|nr:hypothetical protein [Phycisphaerae bacterium]
MNSLGLSRRNQLGQPTEPQTGMLQAGGDLRKLGDGRALGEYHRVRHDVSPATEAASVKQLANILAWLGPSNVIQREYPSFDMARIPGFRRTATKMLAALGRPAAAQLVQDLVHGPQLPPGCGADMEPVKHYEQDMLDALDVMAKCGADDRVTSTDVEGWIASIVQSQLTRPQKSSAIKALMTLLSTSELGRFRLSAVSDASARRAVLIAFDELLRTMIRESPSSFADFRASDSEVGKRCEEILDKTSSKTLKIIYDRTGDPTALGFLLERNDFASLLDPAEFKDPRVRDALAKLGEKARIMPRTAAVVVGADHPTLDQLKKLVVSGEHWERVGAYELLCKQAAEQPDGVDWLLTNAARLSTRYQQMFGPHLSKHLADASTEALVQALEIEDPTLRSNVVTALLQRSLSDKQRAQLRKYEAVCIAAFARDRSANRGLIDVLANSRTKASLSALIDGLVDPDPRVWMSCRDKLCLINPGGTSLGPRNSAEDTVRKAAQQEWRAWLTSYREPE